MKTAQNAHPASDLESLRKPVADELRATDALINQELASNVPLIQTIMAHIVHSGGKRLRPLLVLLSAKACGYEQDTEHHELAAVIEFIHTATLLHDDVVDHSNMRRGQQTANALWGNSSSVLVGDFLYSRAFQILARRDNIPVMRVLANTTNQISEGEVWQLMNQHNADINEATYYEVIRRKTAQLFSAAAEIGGLIGQDPSWVKPMAEFGLHLGMAYQIIDDLLDYTASLEEIGKNIGDDLAEGKATLPLIFAKQHAKPKEAEQIRSAIQNGGLNNLPEILSIIESTNAKNYTYACASKAADSALTVLQQLPHSPYRNALETLTSFVVSRHY